MLTNYQANSVVSKRNNKVARSRRRRKGEFDISRAIGTMAGNLGAKAVNGLVSFASSLLPGQGKGVTNVAPLARSIKVASREPKFSNSAGMVTIDHVEAIVLAPGPQIKRFTTNSLKWLGNVAAGFEEYKISLEYGYVPICPATTTGSVKLAWDYDPSDTSTYADYQDYFNTADHCIASAWSAAYISPKGSGWLKTGDEGEARLYSPGSLKYEVTNVDNGYLMVRYKISLRKPQPNANNNVVFARYRGLYTSSSAPLAGHTLITGNDSLVRITGDATFIQQTEGRIVCTWSTDSPAPTARTFTGSMLQQGTLYSVGSGVAFGMYSNSSLNTASFTVTPSPGGPSTWELTVFKLPESPYYQIT